MKKILITGANGFIGKQIYTALRQAYSVTGIVRNESENPDFITLDLSKKSDVIDFFAQHQFNVIIHLATILANTQNRQDTTVFFKNLEIQNNLIEALKFYQDCHLINFSSSAVYPNVTGIFSEEDKIDPSVNNDALYGLSKFTAENLFKIALPRQIKQLHLRVGYVYGSGMDPNRIQPMFKKELDTCNTITVFGNGVRTIPQISITSLSKILESLITKEIRGVLNVADENISLEGIAKELIRKYGNEKSSVKYIEKGNKNQFGMNLNKLKEILIC